MGDISFEGDALAFARERRGYTKKFLAEQVNVTAQMITKYESGKRPPEDRLLALAQTLNFPLDALGAAPPSEPIPVDAVSFRKLSRMTAAQRNIALSCGRQCFAFNDWAESEYNLPELDLPELENRGEGVEFAEGAAYLVRGHWGLGNWPIENILNLVEAKGVRVFAMRVDGDALDAYSVWHSNVPFVLLRTDKTAERTVFDIAHELGHLVMHRKHDKPSGRDRELEADRFASALLMPREDVVAHAPRDPSIADLAIAKSRWGVSAKALNYRMHSIGLTSDWHYRGICIEMGKRGKNWEPRATDRTHSELLTSILRAAREDGLSRGHIAAKLLMSRDDLDDMLTGLSIEAIVSESFEQDDAAVTERPVLRLVK